MLLEDHFGSGSTVQRNERVKLPASFWNNVGAEMVIGGMAAAFFLENLAGAWNQNRHRHSRPGAWLCYSIASNMLTVIELARASLVWTGGQSLQFFSAARRRE